MKAPGGAGVTGGNGVLGTPRGVVGWVLTGRESNISEDASSRGWDRNDECKAEENDGSWLPMLIIGSGSVESSENALTSTTSEPV